MPATPLESSSRREPDSSFLVMRRAGLATTIVAAAVVAFATLGPSRQQTTVPWLCVLCGALGGVDFILNVLLFAPLGFGLSLAGVTWRRGIGAIVASTLAIEALQIFVVPGRDASVGDVIANSLGGALGWLVAVRLGTLLRPQEQTAWRLLVSWLVAWLVLQWTAAYAITPTPSMGRHYGRVGRAYGGSPPYAGRILAPTLNAAPIPDMSFPRSSAALDALSRGSHLAFEVTVIPGPAVPWATIAQIVDSVGEEVVLGAARRRDFVFGVRSAAATLYLRSLRFRLPDAFAGDPADAAPSAGDTVRLRATYVPPRITLSARTRSRERHSEILLSASSGWRLLTPAQTYLDGSGRDDALNGLWLFALFSPAGYWAGYVAKRSRKRAAAVIVLATLSGLSLGPVAFGLRIALWSEALGSVAGLASGLVAARVLRRKTQVGDSFRATPAPLVPHRHNRIA